MESSENSVNISLVNLLFGKLVAKQFLNKGKFIGFYSEKKKLLDFISAHLKQTMEQDSRLSKIGNRKPTQNVPDCLKKNFCTSNYFSKKTYGQTCKLVHLESSSNNQNRRDRLGQKFGKWIQLFKKLQVDPKFISHYQWLTICFGFNSNESSSFQNLIIRAYSNFEETWLNEFLESTEFDNSLGFVSNS